MFVIGIHFEKHNTMANYSIKDVEHLSGVKAHTKLDDKLKTNGTPQHLNLNDVEKMALVAFLNTLTDQTMITDPKFANPFKQ